ncbi:RNA-directed DNA polymerase [Aureimonas altamirensis]|uniref:RNA-directed DNA polymerase n=1 Tax=Aureimonas altamirensis TaxID=370622 RepID=UPI003017563D
MKTFLGDDKDFFVERILEQGYLPENIPPVFQVRNLHECWLSFKDEKYISNSTSESSRYSATKRGGSRRIYSIPNPAFMMDCAKFFLSNCDIIEEHISNTDESASYPQFSPVNRAISISSFPEFHRSRRSKLALSRYIVRADISRYYHSIYTHSLPWALHGKSAAKLDRKIDSSTIVANRLDWILRQSQDGQTVGIPVGPDFSRIISEIIGAAIDRTFRKAHPDAPMLRLVDDIYIGADNIDEAHTRLEAIRSAIHYFELDINESKTTIIESNFDLEPYWPVELRREIDRFQDSKLTTSLAKSDISHFLDDILRRSNTLSDDGVVKFAIRRMDSAELWTDYWDVLEPFLMRVAVSYPHCWDYVARIVSWRYRKYSIDVYRWQDAIHTSVLRHSRMGRDSEVAWALWLLKEIKGKLSQGVADMIIEKAGTLPCLLALDILSSDNSTAKIPKEALTERLGDKPMLGAHWMLAYEGDRQFDLKIKTKNLQGSELFSALYSDTVSFYDAEAKPYVFEEADDGEDVDHAIENAGAEYSDEENASASDEDAYENAYDPF